MEHPLGENEPDYVLENGEDDEEEFEVPVDCGIYRDSHYRILGCSMAGTEDCQFDCPHRKEVDRALNNQPTQWRTT
jgi:hypothetical protein